MSCVLEQKPEISYPTFWEYKVILDKDSDEAQIFSEVVGKFEYSFSPSKSSSSGKFKSFSLNVLVFDEKTRLEIFELLKNRAKFVL